MTTIDSVSGVASAYQQSAVSSGQNMYSGLSNMFLDLLVAQIRHQNPLDPMDGTQYVSQLAEFANVESLQSIKLSLAKGNDLNNQLIGVQAAALMGHSVDAPSSAVALYSHGDISGSVAPGPGADKVTVSLYNQTGDLVESAKIDYSGNGTLRFDFKSKAAGFYKILAEADYGGIAYPVQTWISGQVEGISLGSRLDDTVLAISGLGDHSLTDVIKLRK